MLVRVKLFGLLAKQFPEYDGELGLEVDIPEGARVEDLFSLLGIQYGEADIVVVKGKALDSGCLIEEGMCLHFFPYISGG